MYRIDHSLSKAEQVAKPSDYLQGWFKDKPCKTCKEDFSPCAPCELYCSDGCKAEGITSAYLVRTHGITYRDYLELRESQGKLCAICRTEGWTMAAHHKLKLVVDHCHSSGVVRGLLCHNCNRGLGLFQDDPSIMTSAAEYIKESRSKTIGDDWNEVH